MRLEEFVDPILGKTWGDLGASIKFSGSSVKVGLGYPVDGLADEFQKSLSSFLNTPDSVSYTHLTLPTICSV